MSLFDEQEELKEFARESSRSILGSTLKEDDEGEVFRPEYMHALGEAGLCGIPTAESYGGLGMGYLEYSIVLEEIARVSASIQLIFSGLGASILKS